MNHQQDYTKPSRTKRRLKRRWKKKPLGNLTYCPTLKRLIKLTPALLTAKMAPLSQKTKVGSRNPYLPGDKTPQPIAAFLCLSFSAASCRIYSVMAGLFGQRSALAAPGSGFRPHLSPPPDTVESIDGGYSLLPGVSA